MRDPGNVVGRQRNGLHRRLRAFEAAFEANLRALGTHTINSTPSHPQTCGKIERFWQTLKKWLRARPIRPPSMNSTRCWTNSVISTTTTDLTERLRGATPADVFTATEKARPADRPLPAPVFVSRHTVGEHSGKLPIAPYRVNVGLRWAGHNCDVIRQGDHIAIFSGTTLVGNSPPTPAALPARRRAPANLPHPRTQTAIMSVSDVPRHKCQRCPETPHRAQRDQHAEITRWPPR